MNPLRPSQLTKVLAPVGVLGVLWLVLPMPLPAAGAERSFSDCLTMADTPSTDIPSLQRCHDLVPDDVELAVDLGRAYEIAGRKHDAIAAPTFRRVAAMSMIASQSSGARAT